MKLKIDDVVYQTQYGNVKCKFKIDRVTKTLAFSGGSKFKIEYSDPRFISSSGDINRWDTYLYSLETQELKDKYDKYILLFRINKIDFSVLSLEQLRQINQIINPSL